MFKAGCYVPIVLKMGIETNIHTVDDMLLQSCKKGLQNRVTKIAEARGSWDSTHEPLTSLENAADAVGMVW